MQILENISTVLSFCFCPKDPPRLSVQSLPFNYLGWKHLVEVSLMILKITDLKWEGMEVADPQTTCPIGIRNFM
jgi:hypothetical protein